VAVTHPTRQEQARAILERRGWQLASQVLGRRATNAADFAEAFTLERIDVISEIPNPEALLALGRNVVGPRDGLYVIEDGDDSYRIWLQEKGEDFAHLSGTFTDVRDAVVDRLIQLAGLPLELEG
jgi:hypothetical protein